MKSPQWWVCWVCNYMNAPDACECFRCGLKMGGKK